MIMEVLCDQAIESLDHTVQKEKGELAQRGKLGKRRRPSRASLKAQLATSTVKEEDETQTASGKKPKDEDVNFDQEQANGGLPSTEDSPHEDQPIIKQGPKGTVIEIGTIRNPDASTVICINYPIEENACHTGAVITGAILKSPSERRLSEMAGTIDYSNGVEPEVEESEEENEEANCKRWKSLPSLWQAAKSKVSKKEQTKEEEEEAPWAHEVKLRHVEDPECAHRGCSMLFFGPLPKSHQSPTGRRRDTGSSGSDSQFPDTQHNGTDVIYRPIRPRPSSVCDQVQIQTWDRRHLTTGSRTNADDAQQKCELQRNGVINLETDALLLSDLVVQKDKPATDLATEKEPATYKRPKPKKRWKLDAMDNGVQRSKSLNGIDRSDQPEWIELSRRLTSRNIDWDNLPTIKGGSTGRNLQNELKLAWKIKGTEQRAENYLRSDGKEEIVLSKEDLAVIPNGFTKLSSKATRWEKLDSNANIPQRQKSSVPNPTQNSADCQKNRALPHQPSAQEEAISWIKEAEKRRRKYMDWQSQETMKLSEETANQKPPKEITITRRVSTPPEIVGLPKNTPAKLPTNEQLDPLPITEEPALDFKKEKKIKDAVREELSLFSVKLRRVRCAKPEECFHEVKCQPPLEDNQQSPEPKAIVVPTMTQPPVPSPRTKKPRKVESEVIPRDAEPKPTEECSAPRASFSVQVSEQESDNFFIVINDQDDDSFLKIKSPQITAPNKLSSSVTEKNSSGINDIAIANELQEQHKLSFTPLTSEQYEIGTASIRDPCDANTSPIKNQSNDRLNSNHIAMGTTETGSFKTMETLFHNLTCEDQPESIIDIDFNANEPAKNDVEKEDVLCGLVNGDTTNGGSPSKNGINTGPDTKNITVVHNDAIIENGNENTERVYGKIQNIPNGIILHENNYLNLNGHRNNRKQETAEEKAARMTSEICGVLSSLGNRKTEAEKLALHMDILTTLTCPNAVCPKNASSRTMTFVTCNGESAAQAQVCGPHSVGVQTNGIETRDSKMPDKVQKKAQTRIKKKTVKIIIHECDDEDEKQEVVEEIVEEILEPRSQKGRMVKTPSTISRTIAEAEDGSKYLTTTVMDNCVFRPEDAT